MPVRGLGGSDLMRVRPDFHVIENPYAQTPDETDAHIVVVPAVHADVAILHGFAADVHGTVELDGRTDDRLAAQAADHVIVTVERIVDDLRAPSQPNGVLLGGWQVDAVVEAPHGSHPTACAGHAPLDAAHIREYVAAARDSGMWARYWERYVGGPGDAAEYWAVVTASAAA